MLEDDLKKLAAVSALIAPYGCQAIALTPDAVGVMGDARSVGPGVLVRMHSDISPERQLEISTLIINQVSGLTRVLVEVKT